MSYLRLFAIVATALLLVTACNKPENTDEVTVEKRDTSLFDFVPSDTPYLAGNLQPIPDEVIEVFLQRFQPVFDSIQEELGKTRHTLENDAPEQDKEGTALVIALLQEFDGKLNREGVESLGFDLRSHKVIYGMGVFPVIRIGLSNADALRATVQRVLDNAGIDAQQLEHEGVSYWRLSGSDPANQPIGMYVSIFSDHLAMGIFPPMAETEMLPEFLGLKLPVNSNAAARLAELNAKHGYSDFGSGILDLDRLVERFISPDSIIAQVMSASGHSAQADLTPECIGEIRGMTDLMPRWTIGTQELTTSAIAIQYRIETETTLAQQLAGLVADIPIANPLSKRLLEISFGMRFGAVRDFLREKATAIMEDPYQCEHFQSLNDGATEAFAQLNQPMPPLVNNFRGLRLSLSTITETSSMPVNGEGLIAVHVDKPEMFVGMAQMLLPDLSEMTLLPGEPPVQVPASLLPMPDAIAFAALSEQAIGLSIGAGEEVDLPAYLAEEAGPDGTFMSLGYDISAYLDYTQKLQSKYTEILDESGNAAPGAKNISESVLQAMRSFSDRSYTTFRFTDEGFESDSRMTFK